MPKVVLAEDDETMVQLLSTLLRMDGYDVESVDRDGDVADAVLRLEPDALLLDVLLDRQNGLEILDRLRNTESGAEICVIMMSGLSAREECMQHGADDFLMKPFMPEDLTKMLSRHVGRPREEVTLRPFRYPDDYGDAVRLWESSGPGVRVGASDTPAEVEKKLQRDPDLFLVAECNGGLVGTVVGGFDGRRGFVYHLAVEPAMRRQGVARRLMDEVERRLRLKGCIRCYLLVRPDNAEALAYYKSTGWTVLDDVIFAKDFR